ncbi:MAG: SHOCT domain-containing protein [Methanomicrobiales archaeon]|nr:SHOCT domain-containing protein [Methanomicrobiales archaeon]
MDRYLHLHQGGHHMFEGWPALPSPGWGMMLIWLPIFFVIAFLVYRDANRRGMNGLLWFILVILPMVGFIFLILYLVIREQGGVRPAPASDTAMDLLRERYARGEIDEEEFRKRREELERKG